MGSNEPSGDTVHQEENHLFWNLKDEKYSEWRKFWFWLLGGCSVLAKYFVDACAVKVEWEEGARNECTSTKMIFKHCS